MDLKYLLRCNIKYADLPFTFQKHSMWDEVWKKWCHQNYQAEIDNTEAVLNQNIWLNSHIKINHKVFIYRKWADKGIQWISDILMENEEGQRRFMTQQEIAKRLGFTPMFTSYIGLQQAIPKTWRRIALNKTDTLPNEDLK